MPENASSWKTIGVAARFGVASSAALIALVPVLTSCSSDSIVCSTRLSPSGEDDTEAAQTALIEAESGDTVCFRPGHYHFNSSLSVTTPNLTVRGLGNTREDTILDFAQQTSGSHGIHATADGFTVENLWIRNTVGDGVRVSGANDVTFRNLYVTWDAGSVTENGAYAVYPVNCDGILIEDVEVVGASDAGIYVGQSRNAVVRRNVVHGNVAGIEIENSDYCEVYENEVYDNTAGIFVFVMPNLTKKDGSHTIVRDNVVRENDRANFAPEGTTVSFVPRGTGFLIISADDTEVFGNEIRDNRSVGMLVLSTETLILMGVTTADDEETDPYLDRLYVHDNTFANNGRLPVDPLTATVGRRTDILWDGVQNPNTPVDPAFPNTSHFCIGDPPSMLNYLNINGVENLLGMLENFTDDPAEVTCTLPPVVF